MKKNVIYVMLIVFVFLTNSATTVWAKPNVVATTADMASIVKYLAGDLVKLKTIYKGQVDSHFFQPRPQHVVWLNKADLLVVAGLGGEGWIYPLLKASRNPKIQIGKKGFVDPSVGVTPMQVPDGRIDGSMGHVHPWGNPHYWFSERNLTIAVENIAGGLVGLLPQQKDYVEQKKQELLQNISDTFAQLRKDMEPLKGTAVIQYHQSWDYFCREFGLVIVGQIEPKPGVPPTPSHLRELRETIADENVRLLIAEPYYPSRPIKKLLKGTHIKALRLALYMKGEGDILDHIRNQVKQIKTALQ